METSYKLQTLNKRVKEISLLQIDNLKLEEDNKNTLKIIDEIINDPKTTPEISYSVNKFINNGFQSNNLLKSHDAKDVDKLGNSSDKLEKDKFMSSGSSFMPGVGSGVQDENQLSQVFQSKLTSGQYLKLKDVYIFPIYLL